MLDIDFSKTDSAGDCPIVKGLVFDSIQIKNILSLQQGEWFRDVTKGVNWLALQEKQANNTLIKDAITGELWANGYTQIQNLVLNSDPSKRSVIVEVHLKGQTIKKEIQS